MAESEVPVVEASSEPRHKIALHTPYLRMLRVRFPMGDTTLYHRHNIDSFYIDLAEARLRNDMVGAGVTEHNAHFGTLSYKQHSTAPYIHRITCLEGDQWFCIDGELLEPPPFSADAPISDPGYELKLESPRCRIYQLTIPPGETVSCTHGFHGALVALTEGTVEPHGDATVGDMWELVPGPHKLRNTADSPAQFYVVELIR